MGVGNDERGEILIHGARILHEAITAIPRGHLVTAGTVADAIAAFQLAIDAPPAVHQGERSETRCTAAVDKPLRSRTATVQPASSKHTEITAPPKPPDASPLGSLSEIGSPDAKP